MHTYPDMKYIYAAFIVLLGLVFPSFSFAQAEMQVSGLTAVSVSASGTPTIMAVPSGAAVPAGAGACPAAGSGAYQVTITPATQILALDRTPITFAAVQSGDRLNVYGVPIPGTGCLQALIVRDLSIATAVVAVQPPVVQSQYAAPVSYSYGVSQPYIPPIMPVSQASYPAMPYQAGYYPSYAGYPGQAMYASSMYYPAASQAAFPAYTAASPGVTLIPANANYTYSYPNTYNTYAASGYPNAYSAYNTGGYPYVNQASYISQAPVLQSGSITLTSPRGGSAIPRGSLVPITWSSYAGGGPAVDILLIPQSYTGQSSYTIARGVAGSAGSFSWTAGGVQETGFIPDGSYAVRVCFSGTPTCDQSLPFDLTGNPSRPQIYSVNPSSGSSGERITLLGTGFAEGSKVYFNHNLVDDSFAGTSSNIIFLAPSYVEYHCQPGVLCETLTKPVAPGTYPIQVVNPNGGTSNIVMYTLVANSRFNQY